ncbi:hypothetical protein FQZ97_888270 [compost metagenome]
MTSLEQLDGDRITSGILLFAQTELPHAATGGDIRLGKVTGLRLGHARGTTLANSYLNCAVAIAFFAFELGDAIRLDLDDRNRNRDTIFGENAGHAALTTDNTNCHVMNLFSVRGFHPLWPPISERYTTNAEGISRG